MSRPPAQRQLSASVAKPPLPAPPPPLGPARPRPPRVARIAAWTEHLTGPAPDPAPLCACLPPPLARCAATCLCTTSRATAGGASTPAPAASAEWSSPTMVRSRLPGDAYQPLFPLVPSSRPCSRMSILAATEPACTPSRCKPGPTTARLAVAAAPAGKVFLINEAGAELQQYTGTGVTNK